MKKSMILMAILAGLTISVDMNAVAAKIKQWKFLNISSYKMKFQPMNGPYFSEEFILSSNQPTPEYPGGMQDSYTVQTDSVKMPVSKSVEIKFNPTAKKVLYRLDQDWDKDQTKNWRELQYTDSDTTIKLDVSLGGSFTVRLGK